MIPHARSTQEPSYVQNRKMIQGTPWQAVRSRLQSAGIIILAVLAGCAPVLQRQDESPPGSERGPRSIADFTAGMESREGFLTLHMDSEAGKAYLEVGRLGEQLLHTVTLATGLGTRPNRDRAQTQGYEMAVVHFERQGSRVFLVRENTRFIASSGDPGEVRAVRESFPTSVLASMPIVRTEGERLLVDATDFLLSDAWDLRSSIRGAGQGEVRLDRERSAISLENTRSFPENTEVRAILTFVTDAPHDQLRLHAPDGRFVTVEQHHSFLRLPEVPLEKRAYDPRTGHRPVVPLPSDRYSVQDFSQPFDSEYEQRFIYRWRLEPSDTVAYARGELVEPLKPIVFYIDPGLPGRYEAAYREGVDWWNRVFESAGFRNAVQVRDLPEGADPMDIRYSMINTVHRSVRGNSVGGQVWDPRTGELLFAIARVDSRSVMDSYNLYSSLLPAYGAIGLAPQMTAEEFVNASLRELVAHELGHALGYWHNFIAESQGRSSVMDYRARVLEVDDDGRLDLSGAYMPGGGHSDSLATRYSYTWYSDGQAESAGLQEMVQQSIDRGYRYISDPGAVPSGSYPQVHRGIAGTDLFQSLENAVRVRRILLTHLDERAIRPGEPMAWLNQRLATVYLYHRPAVEAMIKFVGGMEFSYALRGDGQTPVRVLPPADQRRALDRVLAVLAPEELSVPTRILDLIPPVPWGFEERSPWIQSPAGPALDPVAMARSFAQEIIDNLLDRERAARVVAFHARDPEQPSLDEILQRLVMATWEAPRSPGAESGSYLRATERALLDGMLALAADEQATAEVRNAAERRLVLLRELVIRDDGQSVEDQAQRARARREIDGYLENGTLPALYAGVMNCCWSSRYLRVSVAE